MLKDEESMTMVVVLLVFLVLVIPWTQLVRLFSSGLRMDHLELFYRTSHAGGLLQSEFLQKIRDFELDLRDGPLYQKASWLGLTDA